MYNDADLSSSGSCSTTSGRLSYQNIKSLECKCVFYSISVLVCMHQCVCVCLYTCIFYKYVCMYIHVYVYLHMYMYICVYLRQQNGPPSWGFS